MLQIKNFTAPDEVRTPMNTRIEVVNIAHHPIMRATFAPGWRWSQDIKPVVGTEWCEVAHLGYQLSGRMHIKMASGEEIEMGPGDLGEVPPGHDAWVIGEEPVVMIDFQAAPVYAKKQHKPAAHHKSPYHQPSTILAKH